MSSVGRCLVALGVLLILCGGGWEIWQRSGMRLGFTLGKLPGDIVINRPGMKFYFPLMTCVIVSVVISLLGWVMRLLSGR